MRQLKYIGAVFAALMLFTACEKNSMPFPKILLRFPKAATRLGRRR